MATLRILDRNGLVLAETCHETEPMLCLDHPWEEGDCIELDAGAPSFWRWRLDSVWDAAEVFLPSGVLRWTVPQGEHRLSYAPGAFDGKRHIIIARRMTDAEIRAERDLARNPSDLRGGQTFYPHCTANVETRNESVFAARNVIDGLRFNTSHGEWPFESWGIGAREDAWCLQISAGRSPSAGWRSRCGRIFPTMPIGFPATPWPQPVRSMPSICRRPGSGNGSIWETRRSAGSVWSGWSKAMIPPPSLPCAPWK